jgi:hypothetical protein
MSDYDISVASTRGYASLLKKIDKWTPYVGYAFLRPRNFYLDARARSSRWTGFLSPR